MAITNGPNLNVVPASGQQTLSTNYLDLNGAGGWAQQYLPDLMEKEAEVFGPRTISGFLSQVGAEESMTADQVIWSEQGRLHLSYLANLDTNNVITIQADIDGNSSAATGITTTHGIRKNDTVVIANATGVYKAIVVSLTGTNDCDITVAGYDNATIPTSGATGLHSTTVLVYGSEFGKGDSYNNAAATARTDSRGANEPGFKTFHNKPIIMKDYYEVSGSDTARVGWVEVAAEDGQAGYLWYLKAEADTRARFNDYVEMAMIEGVKGSNTNAVDTFLGGVVAGNDELVGTEGLFAAIESRGNITSGITGVNAATDLAEFDAILAEFDKQGAIEENMMFVNRATSLAMDDMLASMNSYGAGGTSYGVFDNSEDMALNLGFSGFRRGSYDFYKSDMRYLNDKATRGGINDRAGSAAIRGVVIPAGVSSVYDQALGKNMKRPFLHVRYRASNLESRKFKTWVTGSVGAATSDLDAMTMNFLSERCMVTQGANNFCLLN